MVLPLVSTVAAPSIRVTAPVSFLVPKVTSAVWPSAIRSTSYLPTEKRRRMPSVEASRTASMPVETVAPSVRFISVMMPSKSATMPPWDSRTIRAVSSYSSFWRARLFSSTFWLLSLRSALRRAERAAIFPASSSAMACQASYMAPEPSPWS